MAAGYFHNAITTIKHQYITTIITAQIYKVLPNILLGTKILTEVFRYVINQALSSLSIKFSTLFISGSMTHFLNII